MTGNFIGGKWGYIDKTGKYVIKPKFDFANDFVEGLAYINVGCSFDEEIGENTGGKWGYVDKKGAVFFIDD